MDGAALVWWVSAALFSGPEVIENPRIATLQYGSAQTRCFAEELRRQAPVGLIAPSGDIYVSGPGDRRDVAPAGSVVEIMAAAPHAKRMPMFVNLSVWLETPDRSLWQKKFYPDGSAEYTASGVLNPAKVFDRVQFRHLFDFDLSSCL